MLYSTPFLNKPLWEEDEAIIFLMNIEIPMWKAKSEIRSLDFQEQNDTKFNPEKLSRKMALENWLNNQTRLVDSIKNHLAADVSLGKLKQIILKDRPHYHREKFIDWVFDNQICQFIGNKESLRIFDEIRNETDNQAKATQQQAKPVGDAGAVDDAITEPVSAKVIQNKTPRTRKTNLSRAVDAAIKTFGSKPSFDELWQFFQGNKDETGFIQDYTDTHIIWIDTKGKLHDTQKETLANHLSRVRS
ncbi:MAG TPA: hypothetical protein VIF37_03830 [Methylobacter sp.]|jgi:hypothetical protein